VLRKSSLLLLFILTMSLMPAFADNISFSGSGMSGTIAPGQPFAYNFDGAAFEPDWGVPGVGGGLATWNGPTIGGFTITFDLPAGVSIDAADIGTNCNGGATSGTVFCASPYDQPWDVTALSGNSITFTAQQNGGDLLTNGDQFFINIFFAGGDPNGASFTGNWAVVPEPGSMVLFGSAVLGLAGVLRRKRLL
jgi:PEP-CTERM motif